MMELILAEEFTYPNINVYRRMIDGVQNGWRVTPVDGYVMYRTNANDVEYDEEGNAIPVIYYYTGATLTQNYNWNNFSWVAVPRDSVDENYIFGVGNNNHEVM